MKQSSKALHIFFAISAILGWFAVICQFYLLIMNSAFSIAESIVRFFSFFTILTNIVVALCFTVLFLQSPPNWNRLFSRATVLTAIAVYIGIVGIVYNIILRPLWDPQGLQLLVDELLHSVIPLAYLIFWLSVVSKDELQWKNILPWLAYPLVYVAYILTRGAFADFYPYPFIDVTTLGYGHVFLNCVILCIAFLCFSILLVTIAKIITRIKTRS